MPNCQNCDYKWSWLDTAKIGFINNKKCPNCNERQYVSPRLSKGIYAIYFISLIVLLASRPLFDLSSTVFISLGALFVLVMTIIIPFTVKLTNEQEPLW